MRFCSLIWRLSRYESNSWLLLSFFCAWVCTRTRMHACLKRLTVREASEVVIITSTRWFIFIRISLIFIPRVKQTHMHEISFPNQTFPKWTFFLLFERLVRISVNASSFEIRLIFLKRLLISRRLTEQVFCFHGNCASSYQQRRIQ